VRGRVRDRQNEKERDRAFALENERRRDKERAYMRARKRDSARAHERESVCEREMRDTVFVCTHKNTFIHVYKYVVIQKYIRRYIIYVKILG